MNRILVGPGTVVAGGSLTRSHSNTETGSNALIRQQEHRVSHWIFLIMLIFDLIAQSKHREGQINWRMREAVREWEAPTRSERYRRIVLLWIDVNMEFGMPMKTSLLAWWMEMLNYHPQHSYFTLSLSLTHFGVSAIISLAQSLNRLQLTIHESGKVIINIMASYS